MWSSKTLLLTTTFFVQFWQLVVLISVVSCLEQHTHFCKLPMPSPTHSKISSTSSNNRSLLSRCDTCKRTFFSFARDSFSCSSCLPKPVPKKNKQKSEGYCHQSMETVIDLCSSSSDEEEEEPGDVEKHCAVPDDAYFASAASIKPTSNDKNSTLRQINPPSRKSLDIMSYSSTTSYKCVICGSSLQHITTLKGRVLHLKQCSKKYGIQARDLCIKDDNDDHGEITNDEQEMELTCINNESNIINTQAKTISACFSNLNESSKPPRTLNTILMDNAKRLAKCNNIIKKNVPGNKGVIPQKKTTTWKRRPFKVRTMAR